MRSGHYTNETSYRTFVPAPLPPIPPVKIDAEIESLNLKAMQLVASLDSLGRVLPNRDLFLAMFIKKEALLSSQIEGTQASLQDVLNFEQGNVPENVNDVEEVINYIKALNYGLTRLEDLPISLRLIKELHEKLMQGVRGGNKTPGEFRRSQNWIGRPGSTPENASFVPPAVHQMNEALGQLEHFLHEPSRYPLIDCGLIHYQFETIHPFLDGNGRIGRLLITFYLITQKVMKFPLLYISYYLKKHRAEYYRTLNLVHEQGEYEQWVIFFLKGVIHTAESGMAAIEKILALMDKDRLVLVENKVFSIHANALLQQLFVTPLISANDIAEKFKVSFPTASTLLNEFEAAGIIKEITGKKRDRRYAYTKYLAILEKGTEPL